MTTYLIYKLECLITGQCYYGHCKDLNKRMKGHKSKSNKCKSKAIIDLNNYQYYPIEENIPDLHIALWREKYYVENFQCVNRNMPFQTEEEKREINKLHSSNYYYNNITEVKKKKQQKFVCECGSRYTRNHKSEHFKTVKHINYLNLL